MNLPLLFNSFYRKLDYHSIPQIQYYIYVHCLNRDSGDLFDY